MMKEEVGVIKNFGESLQMVDTNAVVNSSMSSMPSKRSKTSGKESDKSQPVDKVSLADAIRNLFDFLNTEVLNQSDSGKSLLPPPK